MGKTNKKTKPSRAFARPTQEVAAKGVQSAGFAVKRTPPIETLLKSEKITADQFRRLQRFRDTFHLAERSPIKSCLNDNPGGKGDGPSVAVVSARVQLGWWLRDMPGQCWEILEAVCGNDMSLSEYCVEKFGGRERYGPRGEFVAVVPINERYHMRREIVNLKFASGYIHA